MGQPRPIFVSLQQACMILPLFRDGHDTLDIAYLLAIPEYEVANRLMHLREQKNAEAQ